MEKSNTPNKMLDYMHTDGNLESYLEGSSFFENVDKAKANCTKYNVSQLMGPNDVAQRDDFTNIVFKVIDMYNHNNTNDEISKELNLKQSAIYFIRDYVKSDEFEEFFGEKLYLKKNRQRKNNADKIKVLNEYQTNLDATVQDIADMHDVSVSYIYRKKNEANKILTEYNKRYSAQQLQANQNNRSNVVEDIAKQYNVDKEYISDLIKYVAPKGTIKNRPHKADSPKKNKMPIDTNTAIKILYDCKNKTADRKHIEYVAAKHGVNTGFIMWLQKQAQRILKSYNQSVEPRKIADEFSVPVSYIMDVVQHIAPDRAELYNKSKSIDEILSKCLNN